MKGNKISRPQWLLLILCVVVFEKVTGALEGGRSRHETFNNLEHKISKRYTLGRVPLSYIQKQYGNEGFSVDKRFSNPGASNFRELMRQTRRSPDDEGLSPSQSYKNFFQYYRPENENDVDLNNLAEPGITQTQLGGANDDVPLTDHELKALLMMLEGYQQTAPAGGIGRNANFYTPPAQYFTQEMLDPMMGKRETGKRTPMHKAQLLGQEQPMSFENSLGDNYPVFLTQKRSKRIGSPAINKRSNGMASVRIKKETDPKVEASLDKIFDGSNIEHDEGHQHQHSTSKPTTAISSSGQIPAPASSLQKNKPKKAIDWSHYFGIDKRQEHRPSESAHSSSASSSSREEGDNLAKTHNSESNDDGKNHDKDSKTNKHESIADDEIKDASASTTSPVKGNSLSSASKPISGEQNKQNEDKLEKAKKDKGKQENDTEEKEDRKWILKEFYKNLAMSTNVKRKRESPTNGVSEDELGKLEKLEKKMEEAGDQIIWDALKYTGKHRDVELSPEELAHVKTEIIQKLAAAYSLEKIREAIDEFRQQLGQLKDKQHHY